MRLPLEGGVALGSEPEDEHERFVDGADLMRVESSGGPTESLWIDHGRLLDENARLLTHEGDRGPEARRAGTRRRRRDEDGAEVEELVGLNDDRVARAALLVVARASRRRETENVAADHVSRRAAERALQAAPG